MTLLPPTPQTAETQIAETQPVQAQSAEARPAVVQSGVRPEVRATPAYPFTAIEAAHKLDQNESPYPFPAELQALALKRMAEREWHRYPDLKSETLASAIARYERWDPAGVVVTPGSNVLIKLLTELSGINRRMLTVAPTFSVYDLEAQMLGAQVTHVPLRPDFSLDEAGLLAELARGGPGLLLLTQPHAPTGHLDDEAAVRRLVQAAGPDWTVVIDEAYYQYSGSDHRALVREGRNRVSLRTFSKAWGLAGLRLGYALTTPELATHLRKLVPAFNVGLLTEVAAEVALEHSEYVQQRAAATVAERERIFSALGGLKTLELIPSRANFYLVRMPDAEAAYRFLLGQGLLVRRQDRLPMLAGCLRVSVGTPEQNDLMIAALTDWDGQAANSL